MTPEIDFGEIQTLPEEIGAIMVASACDPSDEPDEEIGLRYIGGWIPDHLMTFAETEWDAQWNADELYVSLTGNHGVTFFHHPPGMKEVVKALLATSDALKPFMRFQLMSLHQGEVLPERVSYDLIKPINQHLGGRFELTLAQRWRQIHKEAKSSAHARMNLAAELRDAPFEALPR